MPWHFPKAALVAVLVGHLQLSGMVTLAIPCSRLLFSALYFPCKASVGQKFPSLPLGTKAIKRNKFKMRAGAGICRPESLQAFL